MDLIRKDSVLDPIEDDDDIDWPDSPYEVNALDESSESPTELLALITIIGSPWLQKNLKALCLEFIDVFAIKVRREPAMVNPNGSYLVIVHLREDIPRRNRLRSGSKSMLYLS